ncbi:hypothetical protein MMC22_007465 [Lobaria immixta]|nr:hypothetical protein [Lobaria immixta]
MAKPLFRVKALFEYSSPHDDDLSFPNDQIINVTEEEDADWYYGEYEDTLGGKYEGLFPRNFVKMYEPETPPRPSRLSRSKKDLEPSVPSNEDNEVDRSAHSGPAPPQASFVPPSSNETPREEEPRPAAMSSTAQTARVSEIPSPGPPANLATKPASSISAKPALPQVIDKPGTGSFRDRINAFNKPAAPVAPMKPSVLGSSSNSSFIKKPFVPPPPSKNAYVPPPRGPPPQKAYRREEDPEVVAQSSNNAEGEERLGPTQLSGTVEEEEDAPKPTTLQDRIALLQKQQMEQAARHAEGAQKKEKPKRPPKKRMESQEHVLEQGDRANIEQPERANTGETAGKRFMDTAHDDPLSGARSISKSHKSREATPMASPTTAHIREFLSDANDADQSGAGDTEDAEEVSTGRDDSDEKPRSKPFTVPQKSQQPPAREADVGDQEDLAVEDELEEEEVDPEVKKRMEIRERMAKMSGGMGMAGMFRPAGGMSSMTSKKQGSVPNERKTSGNSTSGAADPPISRAPPVPIMPMPGLQVRSPEQEVDFAEVSKEETESPRSIYKARDPGEVLDMEDLKEEPLPPSRRSTERAAPPPVPQDRPVPPPPGNLREAPPLPTDRPIIPARVDSRPIHRVHPSQPLSPSGGSESDDEMSLPTRSLSLQVPASDDSRPSTRDGPPPIPFNAPPSSLPSRPRGPLSRVSDYEPPSSFLDSKERSPTIPLASTFTAKRSSRVPPIPGSSPVIPSSPQSRAPPPPPPTSTPTTRVSTGDGKVVSDAPKGRAFEQSDEEITEYEGDYDTDMAPGATRKEARKSHTRVSSLEDDSMTDEGTFHHSGLPSLGPPMSAAPRAVPPPPPSQPPRNHRQSSDMPRAPPPPPPPPPPSKEPTHEFQDEKPDPYHRVEPRQNGPEDQGSNTFEVPKTPLDEDPDNLYSASPPRHLLPRRPSEGFSQYNQPNSLSAPSRPIPRSSLEVQRTSTSIRRSTDAPRSSSEQGYIAAPIDLGPDSRWWAQPNLPPPVLQNRRDIIFEIEETSTTRRGGKQAITKTVYILYMDYSQTIVTAHFETKDPAAVSLEQRHEPPPARLRQDQLEDAHTRFGVRIGEGANSKREATVGDGSPQALVADLMSAFSEALPPVGVRAYGALVYANLQNATVQQFDEIRSGDIVTFRNAKFQGHRGPMKSKYAIDVGKPDHVGIVVDWDGTKKKVRAWEQGRESKKVRVESFRLSDMRSGEVKVWRVMARTWVGWEGQS